MRKPLCLFLFLLNSLASFTQSKNTPPVQVITEEKKQVSDIGFNPDASVVTQHEVTIKGQKVPYKATAGTMPVWDDDGKTIAGLYYTFYERTDVKDKTSRPIVISFNGGPGSASVWMQDRKSVV